MLLRTTRTAAETSETVTTEDVAEHREDIVHIHGSTAETAEVEAAAHIRTVKTELVILLTGLRVVQHVIGFCSLLEFLLGFLVAGVTVGVILDGYLSIGFLDLIF